MVVPVGTCYEDAWRFLIKQEEGELIHGTVESLGRRIGHGWIKLPTGFIWDPQTKSYFSIKDFDIAASPIEEHRYTVEEAAIMLSRVGKHGPWTKEEREQFLKGGNPEEVPAVPEVPTVTQIRTVEIVEADRDATADAIRFLTSGKAPTVEQISLIEAALMDAGVTDVELRRLADVGLPATQQVQLWIKRLEIDLQGLNEELGQAMAGKFKEVKIPIPQPPAVEVAKPKRYIIKEEPEPLYKSGKKYVAYYEDGTPRYLAAETEQALKTRLLEAEPNAKFVTPPGGNPEDSERLLKVAIEREPLRVAKQLGYEVHRLSPKDIVDKDDYARGYRYRLSKADPTQPYPQIVMARSEGEVAAFLKKKIEGNPDTGTSIIDLRGDYDEIAHVKDGILYRKGNIIQVWWDKWGKETWTGPSEEQARENFNAMKERWSSSELGNPGPEELDLARTLAIIDSRPKGRIIESKLREEFGDAVIDALRRGSYVVSGSAGYNPPLLVSLKGRELIQGGNPMGKVITKEEAIGLLERLSMTPGEATRSLVADEAERREIMQTVQQRVKREQNKWAPMDPREGPPLPRIFAGLRWPWKK